MTNEKRSGKKSRINLIVALVLAVLLVAAAGTTLAYLLDSSNKVQNSFTLGTVDGGIVEEVSGGVKSSVKIKNNGTAGMYVRVAVIGNTVDEDGNITGSYDVSSHIDTTNWVQNGMYYYYKQPVGPGKSTGELLSSAIDLHGYQVTILADTIQASPTDAAKEAWGVDMEALGSN